MDTWHGQHTHTAKKIYIKKAKQKEQRQMAKTQTKEHEGKMVSIVSSRPTTLTAHLKREAHSSSNAVLVFI